MTTENPYAPAPLSASDERLWATLVHIGGIFFGFLPALIGYLLLKDRGAYIHAQTRTALNFQLTALIALFASWVLIFVVIGIFTFIAVGVLVVVFSIIAAIAAYKGEPYTYPLSIPFIKA